MNEQDRSRISLVMMLQAAVYLLEAAVLAGMFTLAASGSPEFALGPIARIFVAAEIPLPA